jgi:RimJ/RimL family protein N-acetyltransferase
VITHQLADGVVFGPLEPWRAEEFAAHVDRHRAHQLTWSVFASRVVDTATARAHLQLFADRRARDEGAIYGIWADGVLSGGALFRGFDAHIGVAEIGVWLAPELEGRGLINATCRLMIDYAFGVRGLHRIEWHCDARNTRSRAAAARLGMTHEGTTRSSFVVNGERIDSEIWAVLASEWPPPAA